MTSKPFPRKEFYVYHLDSEVPERNVRAFEDSVILLDNDFVQEAEALWEKDNKGWTSSRIPSVASVDVTPDSMTLHCGATEYKYLLGMVKRAISRKSTEERNIIHGLSIETIPIFRGGEIVLEQRQGEATQHGVGFYDVPSASQNAEIYLEKAEEQFPGLVKGMHDMSGFPRYHVLKSFEGLKPEDLGEVRYIGFSRGFEVSLDSQFNGYVPVNRDIEEVLGEEGRENRLVYKIHDLPRIIDSIGESRRALPDLYGNKPKPCPQTKGFALIDDCIGTMLNFIYHNGGNYDATLENLQRKGYTVHDPVVNNETVRLNDLV